MTGIRPLPRPTQLVLTQPWWKYRASDMAAGIGYAHLTVWRALHADDQPAHLAIVTETGTGLSVTNGIHNIWATLTGWYGQWLTLIEHYPADLPYRRGSAETLDEAWMPSGSSTPSWRPLQPISPANPDHDLVKTWMDEHGPRVLAEARKATTAERVFQGREIERRPAEFVGRLVTMAGKGPIRWEKTRITGIHDGMLYLEGGDQVTDIFGPEPNREPITDQRNHQVPVWEIARGTIHTPQEGTPDGQQ